MFNPFVLSLVAIRLTFILFIYFCAGLSKIGMAVISYSVEGASFTDREKYPYFFRTIGDNRQYEQVYVQLFQKMKWHRAVAFTEDGQKYTEYISQMEPVLKENGIELTNKKFSKYFTIDKMRSVSQINSCIDILRSTHTKIEIA